MNTENHGDKNRSPSNPSDCSVATIVAAAEKAEWMLQRLGPDFSGRVSVMVNKRDAMYLLTLKKVTEADDPLFVERETDNQDY